MYRFRDVTRRYVLGDSTIKALDGLNLDIRDGSFVTVLGPSGSGKTTLLNLLGGLDRPSEGQLFFAGQDLARLSAKSLADYRRRYVGQVFQSFHLIPHLTAQQNVELALSMIPADDRPGRARRLLERVGLGGRAQHLPDQLSGGQQQRVAIARALAHDPPVILADEPTGNLDPASRAEVMSILRELHAGGHTVVMVTHNRELLQEGDRVLELRDGRVASDSAPPAEEEMEPKGPGIEGRAAPRGWAFFLARSHLWRAKWRTGLVSLGTAIGVGALVLTLSLGVGLQHEAHSALLKGRSLSQITVIPKNPGQAGKPPNLSSAAVSALRGIPQVKAAWANLESGASFGLAGKGAAGGGLLTSLGPAADTRLSLVAGRPLRAGVQGLYVTSSLATMLLPHGKPHGIVGKRVTVDISLVTSSPAPSPSRSFRKFTLPVLGILKPGILGTSASITRSTLRSWQAALTGGHRSALTTPTATVEVFAPSQVPAVTKRIQAKGYGTISVAAILQAMNGFFLVLDSVLGIFGGISLVVAAIMIGLVMVQAVLERTREIGVLKAIGASRTDIQRIFLYEAATIGLVASLVGLAGAYGIGQVLNLVVAGISHSRGGMQIFLISPELVGLALLFGIGTSTLAALAPATRAAGLDPVKALRSNS